MTPCIGRVLGIFHYRVDRRLRGSNIWQGRYGVWFYPPMEGAMAETGLH